MLQIRNFCGTNLKLKEKCLAWGILLALIFCMMGKAKISEPLSSSKIIWVCCMS